MPNPLSPVSVFPVPQSPEDVQDNTSTDHPNGQETLMEFADRKHISRDALLAANPPIDPNIKLARSVTIRLAAQTDSAEQASSPASVQRSAGIPAAPPYSEDAIGTKARLQPRQPDPKVEYSKQVYAHQEAADRPAKIDDVLESCGSPLDQSQRASLASTLAAMPTAELNRIHDLVASADSAGMSAHDTAEMVKTFSAMPAADFNREAAVVQGALKAGDPQRAMDVVHVMENFTGDDKGMQALKLLVNSVDPHTADADTAIGALDASLNTLGVYPALTSRNALNRLLGPYGYHDVDSDPKHPEESAKRQMQVLQTALDNWRESSPATREGIRIGASPLAMKYKESTVSPKDQAFRDAQVIAGDLPDGSNFQGTRAEYRKAYGYAVGRQVMDKIGNVVSSGPGSLIGRVLGGEKGAALGGLLDIGLVTMAARSGHGGPEIYEEPPTAGISAPPPKKVPERELQPDRPDRVVVPKGPNRGGPLDDTAPAPGGPYDSTAPANVKPGAQTAGASSPAPAPKTTAGYDPKADPNNIVNDKTEITVKTSGGEKKMTRGEYYQRYQGAKQWIAEQRHALNRARDPGPENLIKEAAERFGLDENWYSLDNPVIYRHRL